MESEFSKIKKLVESLGADVNNLYPMVLELRDRVLALEGNIPHHEETPYDELESQRLGSLMPPSR